MPWLLRINLNMEQTIERNIYHITDTKFRELFQTISMQLNLNTTSFVRLRAFTYVFPNVLTK